MKVVDMSVSTFSNIADNPRQRDTVRHARKAKKYLSSPSDSHRLVSIAELPNGNRFKLDGHTRCYLWGEGIVDPPSGKLKAVIYTCRNMDDVKKLYVQFDNQMATEGTSDRLSGACREHGIELKSNLLKTFDFAQALRCVNRDSSLSEYELVAKYGEYIAVVDNWMLPQKRSILGKSTKVHTCIKAIAFALLATNEDEQDAHAFVSGIVRDEGSIRGGSRDGIAWAAELWTRRAADGAISGWQNLDAFLDELLWCYRMKRHRKNAPGQKARAEMAGGFKELISK